MTSLVVPERYRSGLKKLGALEEIAMERLLQLIETQPAFLRSRSWVDQIAGKIEGASARDVREIAEAVMSLYSVQAYLSMSVEDLAGELAVSSDLAVPADQQRQLHTRLVALLSSQSLYVTSKALGVLTEEEHTFHDARIVTEIRPIFLEDPSARPAAATIVHLLKIQYHEGARLNEFYVLLTEGGATRLQDVLDRADKKWHSLRALMGELNLPVLGEEG